VSLLNDLRVTGEKLLETELPEGRQVIGILGALVAHIEAKGEQLAELELDKLESKLKPDESEPVFGAPPADAGAPVAVDAPALNVEHDPPPAEAGPIAVDAPEADPSKAQLEAELAQLRAQAAATAPTVGPIVTDPEPPPAP
jgi:hypothetical protein